MLKPSSVAQDFEDKLADIVRKIAAKNKIDELVNNPDFLEDRLYKWHQFGLVTHSKRVRKAFLDDVQVFLKKWGVSNKVNDIILKKVDSLAKKDLIEIAMLFHDFGKITTFGDKKVNRNHEFETIRHLTTGIIKEHLDRFDISQANIDYMTRIILASSALGKEVRDVLKITGEYNLNNMDNPKVSELCNKIIENYQDVKFEVGIFFLCDSLGKTDLRFFASDNKELLSNKDKIVEEISQRNLMGDLIFGALQFPVNIKLCEVYLKEVLKKN